jgi:hypothetical protein
VTVTLEVDHRHATVGARGVGDEVHVVWPRCTTVTATEAHTPHHRHWRKAAVHEEVVRGQRHRAQVAHDEVGGGSGVRNGEAAEGVAHGRERSGDASIVAVVMSSGAMITAALVASAQQRLVSGQGRWRRATCCRLQQQRASQQCVGGDGHHKQAAPDHRGTVQTAWEPLGWLKRWLLLLPAAAEPIAANQASLLALCRVNLVDRHVPVAAVGPHLAAGRADRPWPTALSAQAKSERTAAPWPAGGASRRRV